MLSKNSEMAERDQLSKFSKIEELENELSFSRDENLQKLRTHIFLKPLVQVFLEKWKAGMTEMWFKEIFIKKN